MKNLVAYVLTLSICGLAIWTTLDFGKRLYDPTSPVAGGSRVAAGAADDTQNPPAVSSVKRAFVQNLRSPLGILLTQIVLIVVVARGLGVLAKMIGQPQVIGDMIAGIMLGPSMLGLFSPEAMVFFFPPSSMDTLGMFSQVGVILFMFLVGTDIDIHHFQSKAPTAVWVSHTGIILPYFIGVVLSLYMYESMAPPAVPFTAFALFLGVALSITAFPVLARIVEERLLTQSPLGMMALGCAAIDDVTAWTILAVVLAVVKADGLGGSITTLILVLVYSLVMVFVLKPAFRWLVAAKESRIRPMRNEVQYNSWAAMILAFALLSGLTTEVIGIHSFFGAFLAGAIIPAGPLRSFCKARFESVASGLLLPLFFAFTGLRTQITLLNDPRSWVVAIVVILCAVAGKLGGAMLAARWSGMNWRDAFSLGALMNTRGLMQLIVLNIGYDLGIVSSQMFAILVLMAITTTFMTAPLLSLAEKKGYKSKFAVS